MQKLISVVLSLVLVLSFFTVNVYADSEKGDYQECILEAIHNMETEVDLERFHVQVDEVNAYLEMVYRQYPEYYYWQPNGGTGNKGEYVTLKLRYDINKEQMLSEREYMLNATAQIVNDIGKKFSDMEKALLAHDWICANFMYDYRLFEDRGSENHDILGFLQDGMGVCQSYAYTYMYILRQVGVEAYYVTSDTDNHGWNVVNIDGNWYHVDATFDDPILGETYCYDYMGAVRHDKFLLSDSEIIADGLHDDFEIGGVDGIVCGEYTGNDLWRNSISAFQEINGYWYYLDNSGNAGGLMRTKDFKKTEKIMEIGKYISQWDAYGWAIGNTTYGGYYTGLFEYNEHLFFTDEDEIYVYDTHHNEFNKLPVERPQDKYYFGLNMDGKTLKYLASDSNIMQNVITGSYTMGVHLPTDWETVKEATQEEDGERVKYCYFCGDVIERQSIPSLFESALMGDADGNGHTDTSDLAVVKIFLANGNGEINMYADFNKDGIINTLDLASLKLKLAGAD